MDLKEQIIQLILEDLSTDDVKKLHIFLTGLLHSDPKDPERINPSSGNKNE